MPGALWCALLLLCSLSSSLVNCPTASLNLSCASYILSCDVLVFPGISLCSFWRVSYVPCDFCNVCFMDFHLVHLDPMAGPVWRFRHFNLRNRYVSCLRLVHLVCEEYI